MRFEKLTEKVDFDGSKNFQSKVEIIKESYFGKNPEKGEVKEEVLTESKKEEKPLSTVDIYAKMLRTKL